MLAMNKTYPRCPVGRLSPQGVSRQAPHKPAFTGTGADAEDVGLRCAKPTYKAAATVSCTPSSAAVTPSK